jgi:nitrogen regulatory protein P-II 1
MKKVESIIRTSKFQDVTKALRDVGVNFSSFLNVTAVEDYNLTQTIYSPTDDIKCYLSIVVNDDFEDVTIKAILQSAFTGEAGDGRIFVTKIDEVYKIRTKEQGTITLR